MLNNPGKKIKIFAEIFLALGIIGSIFMGIMIFMNYPPVNKAYEILKMWLYVFGVVAGGILSTWFSTLLLAAFGELVENSTILAKKSRKETYNNTNFYSPENSSDEFSIAQLSSEEILGRIYSEDWSDDYKALCKQELERRVQTINK